MSYESDNTGTDNIMSQLEQYFKRWYWFVVCVILAIMVAFLYLRYSTPLYLTQASVIIKDDKSGAGSELAAFSNFGGLLNKFKDNKIENELSIFRSRRIIGSVIKSLNLNVRYQLEGTIKGTELYKNRPFTVQYLEFNPNRNGTNVPVLSFKILNNETFSLAVANQEPADYSFGVPIELPFGKITVIPALDDPGLIENNIGKIITVQYGDIEKMALFYQRKLRAVNEIPSSNVVAISIESSVREKAEDFVNELIYQYNQDAIRDRNQIAKQTSDFIDSRLDIITNELDSVETDKESFKSQNRLTDIEAEAQLILQNASEFEKRQFDVNTQLELANSMIEYMEESTTNDLLPSNIGLNRQEITESVNNYNELILQRNRLLKNSTAKNPVVVNINNQLEDIRVGILETLKNTTSSLKISLRDLNYQESTLNSKLIEVPSKEKVFRGIERQQSIKEQLYLFLLQQREEASISLAVSATKAKVIDSAYTGNAAVAPNKMVVYGGALMAGFMLPLVLIYLSILMNNKVQSRLDIEQRLPDVSIVGELPKLSKGQEQLIEVNDRSILAESFRILRTNLQYLFISKLKGKEGAHTVFVTSTIKGEGKTFVAFNLALTFALTGKKVVLVGGDIRNPQLQRYLPKDQSNRKGLTEYIIDPTVSVDELTAHSLNNDHLDIILSGAIPPNPAELLMESRTEDFFKDLRSKYDYVIVDTAPSMLVTDTIIINKLADITLYVVRASFTEKKLLEFPKDAIADGRLVNVASVINNVSMSNFGYGNKYGYSYSSEKVSWKNRVFKRS